MRFCSYLNLKVKGLSLVQFGGLRELRISQAKR